MRALRPALLAFALSLTGCASFPELDATLSDEAKAADYPQLLPADALTASPSQARITETTASGLSARVSSLKARAARLRGSVVDSATKQRMRAGVTPPAAL